MAAILVIVALIIIALMLRTIVAVLAVFACAAVVASTIGLLIGLMATHYPHHDALNTGLLGALISFPIALFASIRILSASNVRKMAGYKTAHQIAAAGSQIRPSSSVKAPSILRGQDVVSLPKRKSARRQLWPRRKKRLENERLDADCVLNEAWQMAEITIDWAASRIARAKRSCDHLIGEADTNPLNLVAVEWVAVIRRNVPELVRSCFSECANATTSERRALLEDLIEALENVGAEADRRRQVSRSTGSEFSLHRDHIMARARARDIC